MLTKNAKIVFQLALKSDNKVSYKDIKKCFDWDHDTAKSACAQLINSNLAIENSYPTVPGGHPVPWGISLTEEGRNHRKYFVEKLCSFLVKSVAVPIAVAFVTAILTTLAIGQWLR